MVNRRAKVGEGLNCKGLDIMSFGKGESDAFRSELVRLNRKGIIQLLSFIVLGERGTFNKLLCEYFADPILNELKVPKLPGN